MISIIIPSYNSITYYRECIDSVLKQTYCDIEVIAVDAGSSDGTDELIDEYVKKDPRVKKIKSDKKSYGYQCNIGINASKGDYIGIVESDDCIASDMYERLLCSISDADCDWVKADFDFFYDGENRQTLRYNILPSYKKDLYDKPINIQKNMDLMYRDLNLWNGLYKKNFLKINKIKFNESRGAAFQDIGFVTQTLLLATCFAYIKGPSYYYRQDNALSSVHIKDTASFVMSEWRFLNNEFKNHQGIPNVQIYCVYKKLLGDLTGSIYRFPKADNPKMIEVLKAFGDEIRETIMSCPANVRREFDLEHNINLYLLLNYPEGFIRMILKYREMDKKARQMLLNDLSGENIIIFGCGEYGRNFLAFIRRNIIVDSVCFCDNDVSLQGKNVMGCSVLPPEQAVVEQRKALFVIANANHYEEIKHQLIEEGIADEMIYRAPCISVHDAMQLEED